MNNKRLLHGLKGVNIIINIMNISEKKNCPEYIKYCTNRKGINKYNILTHKLAKYKNYHSPFYSAENYKIIYTFIKTRSIQNLWDDPKMSTFF